MKITACQFCTGICLDVALDMGLHPLVNDYRPEGSTTEYHPLRLCRCAGCGLVQIDEVLPPTKLFPANYPYASGTTQALVQNAHELSLEVRRNIKLKDKLVVDIGSNDGTLLKPFKRSGARVCGVTPETAGDAAVANGIPTIKDYWGPAARTAIEEKHGKATIITAANVLAHVPDAHAFVAEVGKLLEPGGLFISDSHYLGDLLAGTQLDAIYHEHLRYYSVADLTKLMESCDMEVVAVRRTTIHGGSVRVYARKVGSRTTVKTREPYEEDPETVGAKALVDFAERAKRARQSLRALLSDRTGRPQVHALGAPSRASTLLNYAGVTAEDVTVAYELPGSPKIGLLMPGSQIPVVPEAEMATRRPEYLLLLSWHLQHDLVPKLRHAGYKGRFISPLPVARVIDG